MDLTIKDKSMKLLKESIEENLYDWRLGKDFLEDIKIQKILKN